MFPAGKHEFVSSAMIARLTSIRSISSSYQVWLDVYAQSLE
jgi:hypothetical protein